MNLPEDARLINYLDLDTLRVIIAVLEPRGHTVVIHPKTKQLAVSNQAALDLKEFITNDYA